MNIAVSSSLGYAIKCLRVKPKPEEFGAGGRRMITTFGWIIFELFNITELCILNIKIPNKTQKIIRKIKTIKENKNDKKKTVGWKIFQKGAN